jgi:hypothetical protein
MTSFIRRRSMPVISAPTIHGQRKSIRLIVSTAMRVSIAIPLLWPISAHMNVLKVTTAPWVQFNLVHVQQVPIKGLSELLRRMHVKAALSVNTAQKDPVKRSIVSLVSTVLSEVQLW